ncbi:Hypothetical predicted protein [Mytilus galloprovincialis]|uniref:Prolow-density lipoprotein receptor-related protein 1-like beta-propeller domain-containing protein n=1 Tax=Mytilus galloprovincialis TaxID=29158 RepID=A0A8B6G640_MYTGA|nr:Hypothetical predicted protein [Mytilus galloprovincialis]
MFETVVHTIKPVGIAFDSVNNHVYWTEHSHGKIMRCNADGSNVTIILNETEPSAITLDVHNRWIYYGQKLSVSKIFRANFDGKNKTVIIKNLPSYVYGIEVDVSVERLYWMEYQTGDLRSAFFNGSDVRTILSTNATNMNWDIDTDEDFIFYTSNNRIMKINKSLGQNPDVVHTDTEQIDGILLYKQDGKDCGENELMFSSPTWKKNKKGCEYGVN